ncbi:hypothetical protein LB467_09415 [Salegentibacter sp. JZCK2]|uniref:hypothetical protein n=1 Tax=Salegentibacter tibetensis TaxID=2873600 RepID=UPI001CC9B730|nr:hypothetical protein [Salegentibacter tibetensis]MBZ9729903.1 hypothetical protein [Salegentibacter tibetensis]
MKEVNLSVPIQMLIDAQVNGYVNKLRFFLLLKFCYPSGKLKFDREDLLDMEWMGMIKSRKTTKKYIEFLCEKGWLQLNAKTGYYIVKSFDRIREEEGWSVRKAFSIGFDSYLNLKAIIGGILYAYLHTDFWRKTRRKKSVHLKGSTYHFLSPRFNFKEQPAPVAVSGLASIFSISAATASRLKKLADQYKLIEVEKHYSPLIFNKKAMNLCLKYNDKPHNLVYRDGGYRLQLIDTILPLFPFKNRQKLKA